MVLFIWKGIRGGFSQVSHRHAKQDLSHQLLYIDSNNLYEFAIARSLPKSYFHWANTDRVNLLTVSEQSDTGYIAEVDIEIPDHLHNNFNEYSP